MATDPLPTKPADGRQEVDPIGFLLLPNFSMIAFSSAVEALLLANRTSGRALYGWTLITRDGQPVKASNGISFNADASLDAAPPLEMLILCSGIGGHLYSDKAVFSWLRPTEL